MNLTLESGSVISSATERDLRDRIEGEEFAILAADQHTYLQCAKQNDAPNAYVLEFQEGDLANHYRAVDDAVPFDRVIATFIKYLRGDESWKSDFVWQRVEL
ncbi:MAG TPA: hypothetical protein VFK70_01890 [Vicinamibacteria bacterium]|nr:hypothetical protein [Vicinamibacteria bacterium]